MVEKQHKQLYKRLPAMKCKEGCTDCCGPVPFSEWEWEQVADKKEFAGLTCPYAIDGKCEIYENRPFVCRLFGTVDNKRLQCPHGCKPEYYITDELASVLTIQYSKITYSTGGPKYIPAEFFESKVYKQKTKDRKPAY